MMTRFMDPSLYILDEQHKPVLVSDLLAWARWIEGRGNRRVASTWIGSGIHISTVFLGLDHGFGASDEPVLFETMVFGMESLEDCQWCTCTWEQAAQKHEEIVAMVRAAQQGL